jgi:putative transposase
MLKMLNSRYAMYFNKRHRLVSHVNQGRYGAELVDSKDYLLNVSRYIHLNPVEAKMVKTPSDYRWSVNSHITTTKILSSFPEPQKQNYRKFVEGSFPLSSPDCAYFK